MPPKSRMVLLTAVILLGTAWLGIRGLDADTFWYDEMFSYYYAHGLDGEQPATLSQTIGYVADEALAEEPNPPGYYLILNLWTDFAGVSEFAIRSLSVLAGLIAIAFVFRATADANRNLWTGLFALLLIGTSAFFVRYLHEARSYAVFSMFVGMSVFAYQRLLVQRERLPFGYLFLLGVGVIGLLYTHYLSTPLVLAAALFHVLFVRKNRQWWAVTSSVLLAGLAFLPWVSIAMNAVDTIDSTVSREFYAYSPREMVVALLSEFGNINAALVGILIALSWKRETRLLWFLGFVSLLLMMGINVLYGFISGVHYMMALIPVVAVLAGVGLARLPLQARWVVASVWVITGTSLIFSPPNVSTAFHPYQPWDTLRDQIGNTIAVDDTVIYHLTDPDPNWPHQLPADFYLNNLQQRVKLLESFTNVAATFHRERLSEFVTDESRFWLVQNTDAMPSTQGVLERERFFTEQNLLLCEELFAESLQLRLYAGTSATFYEFDNGVQLGVTAWQPYANGQTLDVLLQTLTPADLPLFTFSVGLHLFDADENFMQQVDFALPAERNTCRRARIDVSTLTDGAYALYGLVYYWETGERVSIDGDSRVLLKTFDSLNRINR